MKKLRKKDVRFLESLEDFMWDRYAEVERAKKTGVQSIVSMDQQIEAIPLKVSTIKNLGRIAKKTYGEYCTLLQIVERMGYDSFVDDRASDEEKMVRIHKIIHHSEYLKLKEVHE